MTNNKNVKLSILIMTIYVLITGIIGFMIRTDVQLIRCPSDYNNTIWECEEADIYFITDSYGYCMGEANIDSGHIFFDAPCCFTVLISYKIRKDRKKNDQRNRGSRNKRTA